MRRTMWICTQVNDALMGIRSHWSCFSAAVFGVMLLFNAESAFAIRISAAIPAGSSTQFIVQPGESTTFSIDFTNLDNKEGVGFGLARGPLSISDLWTITPLEPDACFAPVAQESFRIELPVLLAAGATRRCTYSVLRQFTSRLDSYLNVCTGDLPAINCAPMVLLVFGTLPDVGVTVTQIPPTAGTTDLTLRVDVSNASAIPTRDSPLYSECRHVPAGNPSINLPFRMETGFPGACPAAVIRGCSSEPPVVLYLWELTIPPIPANGSVSCLVKIQLRDPSGGPVNDRLGSWVSYPFYPGHDILLLFPGSPPVSGRGYDMNPTNNVVNLTLAPVGVPVTPVPTVDWRLLAALALLLGTFGSYRMRRLI